MGKSKTSRVKKSNKQRTKLMRQGKIRTKRHKKTVVKSKQPPPEPILDEEEEQVESDHGEDLLSMVEKDDLEFLKQALKNPTYTLGARPNKKLKRKQPKEEDEDNLEEEYENSTDIGSSIKRTRHLLPIKSEGAIVRRAVVEDIPDELVKSKKSKKKAEEESKEEINEEEEDELALGEIKEEVERNFSRPLSVADMLAWRQETLAQYKFKIGILSSGLLENPQEKVMNISKLLKIYDEWQPEVQLTLKKLVVVSLLEVFTDILPSYQIKHQDDEGVKLKKDTKHLQVYEKRLLKGYKDYLTRLEKLAARLYKKKGDTRVFSQRDIILGELAIKCMCELLKTHPYFNFSKNLVQMLTPYLDNKHPSVRKMVSDTFEHIFTHDKRGDITLDAVRRINDLVKKRKHCVKCEAVAVLYSLRLDNINLDQRKEVQAKQKKQLANKSRIINLSKKEKKRQKRLQMVEKELLETKAEENKMQRHSVLTEVTKMVFTIYFRILKKGPTSGLLTTALQGVAKFAHCINLEFYEDLVKVLNDLMTTGELKLREKLNCISTVFSILQGHGEAFNIDPNLFYTHLYGCMLQVNAGKNHDEGKVMLECLEKVVLGRRKKLTYQRLVAFVKRLATISLQQNHHMAIASLNVIKQIFQLNRSVDVLIEREAGTGQGIYLPELEEPEYCNATTTAIYELTSLQKHYHPVVREMAKHISDGVPSTGDKSLPPEIAKMSSMDLLNDFDPSEVVFKPPVPPPKKKVSHLINFKKITRDVHLDYICAKTIKISPKVNFSDLLNQEFKIKQEVEEEEEEKEEYEI